MDAQPRPSIFIDIVITNNNNIEWVSSNSSSTCKAACSDEERTAGRAHQKSRPGSASIGAFTSANQPDSLK